MSQVPVNRADGRKRYTHQAYDVTYLGKSLESGPSGYGKRLSATYQASVLMTADAGVTATQNVGDLTSGVYITGVMNHVALTGGTLTITLPAYDGQPEMVITTQPVNLDTASLIFTGINALAYAPLATDRPVEITVAGGTPGETAVVSLLVTPAESGWK